MKAAYDFRRDGTSLPLARHLAAARIEELLCWSCLHDEVRVELPGISVRIRIWDLAGIHRLTFHAAHDGPGKERTWSRSVVGADAPRIAAVIVSDVNAIRREFRRLEGAVRPPGPPRPPPGRAAPG